MNVEPTVQLPFPTRSERFYASGLYWPVLAAVVALAVGYDPQTVPEHDGRDEIGRVPGRILLHIARGLIEARRKAQETEGAETAEAEKVLSLLS